MRTPDPVRRSRRHHLVAAVAVVALGLVGLGGAPAGAATPAVARNATGAGTTATPETAAAVSGGLFTSLAPVRLLDTRSGVGAPAGKVAAGATLALQVTGRGGVPSTGVAAVVLNVTVTSPNRQGHLTVYGDGAPRPKTSNVNFYAGQTVPNLVVTPVGSNGKVALYNASGGSTHLVADVEGYYPSGTAGEPGAFQSVTPARLLDTRSGLGAPPAKVAPDTALRLQVTGQGGVPASGVSAVVLNVTVTAPMSGGHITVHADGTPVPVASNLNFAPGRTVSNLVVAPVGGNGMVALENGSAGTLDLVADVAGYALSGTPAQPGAYTSLTPARLLDTRSGVGAPQGKVEPWATVQLQAGGRGGVPTSGVAGLVLTVTVTGPTGSGYVTAYTDGAARPTSSNVNFVKNQTVANLVMVPVAANGKVDLYNGSAGTTHLIADIAGYVLGTPTTPPPTTGTYECVRTDAQGKCFYAAVPYITGTAGDPYLNQNIWAAAGDRTYKQSLYGHSPRDWYVNVNANTGFGGVQAFPNLGWNMAGTVDAMPQTVTSWSVAFPHDAKTVTWAAYDLWLNDWADEVMIQVDISANDYYDCDNVASATFGGRPWHMCRFGGERVWKPGVDDASIRNEPVGSIEIKQILVWMEDHGHLPRNSSWTAASFGFEPCDTGAVDVKMSVKDFSWLAQS